MAVLYVSLQPQKHQAKEPGAREIEDQSRVEVHRASFLARKENHAYLSDFGNQDDSQSTS
jgi:hypothetical protein